jgi:hypothetical protein
MMMAIGIFVADHDPEKPENTAAVPTAAAVSIQEVEVHKGCEGGKRTHQEEHKPSLRLSSTLDFEWIPRFEDPRCYRIPQSQIGAAMEVLP